MGLFNRNRKVDLIVLRRTKFWNDIEKVIELDPETHASLVEYIYEVVSDARIAEVEKLGKELQKFTLVPQVLGYLDQRRELLTTYKKLKNGKRKVTS